MRKKILAVASNGGHLIELERILPAFDDQHLILVIAKYRHSKAPNIKAQKLYIIGDASRWNKLALVRVMFRVTWILLRERPQIVVSTGAAPGYFALMMGKLLVRARTLWLDSIANVDTLSDAGVKVRRFADLWLTQWSHLERPDGPKFRGTVI